MDTNVKGLNTHNVSDLLKTHLNEKGFYTRRSIQKILKEKGYAIRVSKISSALNYLAKKNQIYFNKITKFWTWCQSNKEISKESTLVFKKEYIEKIGSHTWTLRHQRKGWRL